MLPPVCFVTHLHPHQSHVLASALSFLPTWLCCVSPIRARCWGALRAELLTQLLWFLCWYPHAYIPVLPRVMFSSTE